MLISSVFSSFQGLARHFECDFVHMHRHDYYMNYYTKLGLRTNGRPGPQRTAAAILGT